MKKNLFLLLLVVGFSKTNAQLNKGNFQLGGSFSFRSSSYDDNSPGTYAYLEKLSEFHFNPRAGFFLSDRSVIGLSLGYSTYSSNYRYNSSNSNQKTENINFSVGPYYRRYFPLAEKVAFFANANTTLNFGTSKRTMLNAGSEQETTDKTRTLGINMSPGVSYFLSKKWVLEASMGSIYYSFSTDPNSTDTNKSSNAGINLNLSSFSLGVQYFINR